jgi:hypothetical protein
MFGMTHPFYLTVEQPKSAAHTDDELLEVHLRDWIQWFIFAERHRRVALAILETIAEESVKEDRDRAAFVRSRGRVHLNDQFMMMMAFALENLAKGALVPTTSPLLRADGTLVSSIRTHDVQELVSRLGLARTEWDEFLRMCAVMVSGPNARYPARAKASGVMLTSSSFSLAELWQVFEAIFQALALELLQRNRAQVRITLPQYQTGEQDLCNRSCSHAEWIAWRLHETLPEWFEIPPYPVDPWRAHADAAVAALRSPPQQDVEPGSDRAGSTSDPPFERSPPNRTDRLEEL